MVGVIGLARHDIEVRDKAERSVPLVLELHALAEPGARRKRRMEAFERLDSCFLVCADNVPPLLVNRLRFSTGLADLANVGVVLLWILQPVFRRQLVLSLWRAEIPLFRRRSTCLGEMDSTTPRLMTSSASSLGVQWLTERPLSSAGSQAMAMIFVNCSALNVGVTLARGRSFRTLSNNTPDPCRWPSFPRPRRDVPAPRASADASAGHTLPVRTKTPTWFDVGHTGRRHQYDLTSLDEPIRRIRPVPHPLLQERPLVLRQHDLDCTIAHESLRSASGIMILPDRWNKTCVKSLPGSFSTVRDRGRSTSPGRTPTKRPAPRLATPTRQRQR